MFKKKSHLRLVVSIKTRTEFELANRNNKWFGTVVQQKRRYQLKSKPTYFTSNERKFCWNDLWVENHSISENWEYFNLTEDINKLDGWQHEYSALRRVNYSRGKFDLYFLPFIVSAWTNLISLCFLFFLGSWLSETSFPYMQKLIKKPVLFNFMQRIFKYDR